MKWVKQAVGWECEDTRSGRYAGQGITAAILDTGITLHPDFDRRICGFRDFVHGREKIYDDGDHGTHVAGIIAGSGKMSKGIYSGMAPGARLAVGKVLDEKGNGTVMQVVDGMQWILEHMEEWNIRIVNISVGSQPGLEKAEEERLLRWVDFLWDVGLVVVVSAGNYGPKKGSVAVPGVSRKVITVGSLEENRSPVNLGRRKKYSGVGPTKQCVVKPDLMAPGTHVTSCSGSYTNRHQQPYVVKSGTSMAAPVVSGAAACLLSKYPDMTNVEVKLKLRESCTRTGKDEHGWGLLHVGRLLM